MLAGGCGYSFSIAPPRSFVELEDQDYMYALRATSADGLVIAVREIKNDPYGDLQFWVQAVTNELRLGQGYALEEQTETRAASGETGTLLKFGRDDGAQVYRYWVALFADDDHVWVVEAGGREDLFLAEQGAIEQAIESFAIE